MKALIVATLMAFGTTTFAVNAAQAAGFNGRHYGWKSVRYHIGPYYGCWSVRYGHYYGSRNGKHRAWFEL